jgi:hypothetical protein
MEGTFKLGQWVGMQRYAKDTMPAERRELLDEIGFVWDVHEAKWEEGFAALEKFKAREGHCDVPQRYRGDGAFSLGTWVTYQRAKKGTMSAEHIQRLDEIGFNWHIIRKKKRIVA